MNKILTTGIMALSLAACAPTENGGEQAVAIGRVSEFSNSSHQFTPEVMWQMGRIGAYHLSADAEKAVWGVTYYSVEKNKSRAVIYAGTPGKEETPVALTTSATSEYAPSFIPGTDKVAYMAADAEGTMQLWMMNADGSAR
ncbi:MAG: hypothetical protein IIV71_00005, partial [Bacteroidaceae bacterium]|nr:hypothetical protein [Bacteroidaceae bacterium]